MATFGTEGTKSAILTALPRISSEDYPDGIDVDVAQYMSSLIPQERGFLWSISVINGNDKDRKPVTTFIEKVNQYPGLLILLYLLKDLLINVLLTHLVLFYMEDPYETAAFMRTPSGDLITCYDLHMAEGW